MVSLEDKWKVEAEEQLAVMESVLRIQEVMSFAEVLDEG